MTTQTMHTEQPGFDARIAAIRKTWESHQWLYIIIGFVLGILAYPILSLVITDLLAFAEDLAPEAISTAFTVFVIDQLYRFREAEREVRELRKRLVREVGGQSNETAKAAVDDLRYHGWLIGTNSLLQGIDLWFANLQGTHLWDANLQTTVLISTNLQDAILVGTNLQDANLNGANLRNANMMMANLQGASLREGNLENADLSYTNLQDADLEQANLQGANFEATIMPNGELYYEGMDLEMFTNPDHPNFYDPTKEED